jgi:hypothetical protein
MERWRRGDFRECSLGKVRDTLINVAQCRFRKSVLRRHRFAALAVPENPFDVSRVFALIVYLNASLHRREKRRKG